MSTIRLNHLVSNKTQTQLTDKEMRATIGGNDFLQAKGAIDLAAYFAKNASGVRNLFDPPQRPPTAGEQAALLAQQSILSGVQLNAQNLDTAMQALPIAMQLQPGVPLG